MIKIAGGLYDESICITKKNLVIEPLENCEVTIQQNDKPCFIIDLPAGEICTINGLRMLFRGPNKDEDLNGFLVDQNFEKSGNIKCIQEFFPSTEMPCIVMIKSGTLKMSQNTFSLDGLFKEIHRKVPSISVMKGA
mmetsp:Transcript_15892/g.15309  ORF Transcript_15892/g.15309 Transcript_15892/m.15309 type:complete len:136 (+) Transcript_15892:6-413(+)